MKPDIKKEEILNFVRKLYNNWKDGNLGGEFMPEDSNPKLEISSRENYNYFTFPMALNYQRNSYKLWESSKITYEDNFTGDVFFPEKVIKMSESDIREKLLKYKVALQPNKHIITWRKLAETFYELFDGDIRNLFKIKNYYIPDILNYVQKEKKSMFPYLSGNKICNYWLYVINNYTDAEFSGKEYLNIAPDTHVLQASVRLGIITENELKMPDIQNKVSEEWKFILKNTEFVPIDIHTPLWLWSRNGFKYIN